jgi:hypothetical protein
LEIQPCFWHKIGPTLAQVLQKSLLPIFYHPPFDEQGRNMGPPHGAPSNFLQLPVIRFDPNFPQAVQNFPVPGFSNSGQGSHGFQKSGAWFV